MSQALPHLSSQAHASGRLDAARDRLGKPAQLRQEIRLLPGVAANLDRAGYIAAGQGRLNTAPALLEEAVAIAETSDAQRILRSVEARARL